MRREDLTNVFSALCSRCYLSSERGEMERLCEMKAASRSTVSHSIKCALCLDIELSSTVNSLPGCSTLLHLLLLLYSLSRTLSKWVPIKQRLTRVLLFSNAQLEVVARHSNAQLSLTPTGVGCMSRTAIQTAILATSGTRLFAPVVLVAQRY